MTKDQALYFLEGLVAGLAAPEPEFVKQLFTILAHEYDITPAELVEVRTEIDGYLDEAENDELEQQRTRTRLH